MVIYGALAAAVAGNNNFHKNYDPRGFLPLNDSRAFFRYPLTTLFHHSRLLNSRFGALCAAQKLIKPSCAKHTNQASRFGPDT